MKRNYHYSSTPKAEGRNSNCMLPLLEGKNITTESNNEYSTNPSVALNNYEIFKKSKLNLLKRGDSLRVNRNSEIFIEGGNEEGVFKALSDQSQNKKPLELTEFIISPPRATKKPPLPPKAISGKMIANKPKYAMTEVDIFDEDKISIITQPDKAEIIKDEATRERCYSIYEMDTESCKSNNSSVLKEKNFYDLNKMSMQDKILKSLKSQAKNSRHYIDSILKEEIKKKKSIDEYIEKNIKEKRDKDRVSEDSVKNKKVKFFKDYFHEVGHQLQEKKKKSEVEVTSKRIVREAVDKECLEENIVENGLKEKQKMIKKSYRDFLNDQVLTKKLKVVNI